MPLIFIIVVVWLLWRLAFRKKEKQKAGCFARTIKGGLTALLALCFFAIIFALSASDESPTSTPDPVSTSAPAVVQEHTAAPVVHTPVPTATPTTAPTATPEPATLQEWAETIAQRVYGRFDYEYTNLISVSCYPVDGDPAPMVEIYAKYPAAFLLDNDGRMSNFLYNAKRVTEQLDELAKAGKIEYGSVFIHGRTGFIDKYGTETEGDAAQIRIKAKEAAKVTNWDNVLGDYLPDLSVSFGIHPVIRDGLTAEYLSNIR